MNDYRLIGLDKTEASVVRRHLHQWTDSDEQRIRPLLAALQRKLVPESFQIVRPRWETNIYPLYYWAHRNGGPSKAYESVFKLLNDAGPVEDPSTRKRLRRMVNSEIDIVVEDESYFVFIEAKEPGPNQKAKFQDRGDVRQLVRQYLQGEILSKVIGKRFFLATIGANKEQAFEFELNPVERELLHLAGGERNSLRIVDLSWKPLTAAAQTAG